MLDKWFNEARSELEALTGEHITLPSEKVSEDADIMDSLVEFGDKLTQLKQQSPAAYNTFMGQLSGLKENILQATGISSGLSQIQSAMMAPQRIMSSRLILELEQMVGPITNDMRNWITDLSMRMEHSMAENWLGALIGGIIGGALGAFIGHPTLGFMFGTFIGGNLGVNEGDWWQGAGGTNQGGASSWIPRDDGDSNTMGTIPVDTPGQALLRSSGTMLNPLTAYEAMNLLGTPPTRRQVAKYRLHNLLV